MPDAVDYQHRLRLSQQLSNLHPAELDQVIFALEVNPSLIPPPMAAPADRASALLQWAESTTGCGTVAVEQMLAALKQGKLATRANPNEKILIDGVWTEVEDRLRQSLHNAILLRLDMAEQRHQVSRPWDSQLRTAEQGTKTLEPDTHIADVFDRREVGGKLLILGNPGAGKTTTMLDLAAVLIQRANTQPDHPIPVMFNVSSWQQANQSITDWLLSELKLKYGVSPKLGQQWLSEKKLLPLLDGLDELPPERQEPVVTLINAWLQSGDGPNRLLVCSRIEEYELYATKLALNGAVYLKPLTDGQLQQYLNALEMGSLWATLQQDVALLELVRTPLLLSVSILANEAIDPAQWQQLETTEARMTYLLDVYIERRLHEEGKSREYPPGKQPTAKQTRRWLVWLAQQLQARSEDEFLIEKMQPSMLRNPSHTSKYELLIKLSLGITFGLLTGLSFGLSFSTGFCLPSFCPSISSFFWGLGIGSISGFILGALISDILNPLNFSLGKKDYHPIKGEFDLRILFNDINVIETSRKIELSLRNISSEKFFMGQAQGIIFGLVYGIIPGVVGGIFAFILLASEFFQDNSLADHFDLSFAGLLMSFLSLILLLIYVLLLFFVVMFICVFLVGTFVGIFGFLSGGLMAGTLTQFTAVISISSHPNQGIFTSLKNMLYIFVVSCFGSVVVIQLLYSFGAESIMPFYDLSHLSVLSFILCFSLCFGIYFGGGFTALQHVILRLILFHADAISWNYARFLNHCTERLLLQRVGGRYRFIHKLVQAHFATME